MKHVAGGSVDGPPIGPCQEGHASLVVLRVGIGTATATAGGRAAPLRTVRQDAPRRTCKARVPLGATAAHGAVHLRRVSKDERALRQLFGKPFDRAVLRKYAAPSALRRIAQSQMGHDRPWR